jgi:hypothetical protein
MYTLKQRTGLFITPSISLYYNKKYMINIDDNLNNINKYTIKQLDEYAAIYYDNNNYCDFYENGIYIYSLKKNNDDDCILIEFYKNKNNQIVFIFNRKHGQISICNANTGIVLHNDYQDDKYIISYNIFDYNTNYLYIFGRCNQSDYFISRYCINKLINVPNYQSYIFDCINYYNNYFPINLFTGNWDLQKNMTMEKYFENCWNIEYEIEQMTNNDSTIIF